MDEVQDESQVLETGTPEVSEETPEETKPSITDEEIAELKAKAAKADELEEKNKRLFERAKKAEAKVPSQDGLSAKDFLALKDANISADDFEEVQEFALFKKIPIAEALKNSTLKTILSERNEERRTAAATLTGTTARPQVKVSGEDLLAKAKRTGEVPETDEGMAALVAARQKQRFGR